MNESRCDMVPVERIQKKCPVCGRNHYCLIRPDGTACICTKVESPKRCGEAGWFHRLDQPIPKFIPPVKPAPVKRKNWYSEAYGGMQKLEHSRRLKLARSLGLPDDGLNCISLLGWRTADQTFTFPERDGKGNIIGLNRRFADGEKKHVPGGARGLTLPNGWNDHCKSPLFVVEGPTDTAAMVCAGLKAIGRPSNRGGVSLLAEAMYSIAEERTIIIVGENDQKDDGSWPGIDGCISVAGNLQKEVPYKVKWALAPREYKDVRQYLTSELFEGEDWLNRGLKLAIDLSAKSHDAEYRPDGYSALIEKVKKEVGFDESRWQF